MPAEMSVMPSPSPGEFPRQAFGVALGFLVVVALLGTVLRWHSVQPVAGVNFAYFVHAHSHAAFLGWVFNAFFALALHLFIPSGKMRVCARVFLVLQVAVLGMLVSYPLQGYGAISIALSSLHMVASTVFAWQLWRHNLATPAARGHLRVALGFWLASGLGPLALGPLAAFGLRDSPAYQLTIYFYLHGQYNGWFLFFLQAVLFQFLSLRGLLAGHEQDARRALRWLGCGTVLTLAQSALWLHPPGWVYVIAGIGGVVQLVGCFHLMRALRGGVGLFTGAAKVLAVMALGSFLLKHVLQAGAAWPGLAALATHRFVVVGFLHLVFLGVVAPMLLAWALHLGWLREDALTRAGLGIFLSGALVTEGVLFSMPLGWSFGLPVLQTLLLAAFAMSAGAVLLFAAFLFSRSAISKPL